MTERAQFVIDKGIVSNREPRVKRGDYSNFYAVRADFNQSEKAKLRVSKSAPGPFPAMQPNRLPIPATRVAGSVCESRS